MVAEVFPLQKTKPSHDALGKFYSKINPREFANGMISFMKGLKKLEPNLICFRNTIPPHVVISLLVKDS